jgi:hypothetical protein
MLHPTKDRCMINRHPTFPHELFHIPIAQSIAKVPTDAEQNHFTFKMLPFERGRVPIEDLQGSDSGVPSVALLSSLEGFRRHLALHRHASRPSASRGGVAYNDRPDALSARLFPLLWQGCGR